MTSYSTIANELRAAQPANQSALSKPLLLNLITVNIKQIDVFFYFYCLVIYKRDFCEKNWKYVLVKFLVTKISFRSLLDAVFKGKVQSVFKISA